MAFRITEQCVGCGSCRRKCPWEAISGQKKKRHLVEPTLCRECGTCWYTCPRCAVEDPAGCVRERRGKPKAPKAMIDVRACVGCQNCLLNCEQGAITFEDGLLAGHCNVEEPSCIGCGSCLAYCASGCIELGLVETG